MKAKVDGVGGWLVQKTTRLLQSTVRVAVQLLLPSLKGHMNAISLVGINRVPSSRLS